MTDLFTINLLIFQNSTSLCYKPSVLKGLFSCPFIVFFSLLKGWLGQWCSHFLLCVMKRQHFYMSEFQFTLGFQGKTESFNCQQSLTFRSQLRDICKNTLLSVVLSLQTSQTTKAFTYGFIFWVVINGFQFILFVHVLPVASRSFLCCLFPLCLKKSPRESIEYENMLHLHVYSCVDL